MNYIGKFVSNIREFYNDLNPATLSGAIDVIIVEQEDGTFACSPFHVRFGKRGVFNRREKIVDITINGEPVDLHMKLGETGEAFFVEATEPQEGTEIPAVLATSPLPTNHIAESFDQSVQLPHHYATSMSSDVSCSSSLPTSGSGPLSPVGSLGPEHSAPESEILNSDRLESGNDSDKTLLTLSATGVKKLKSRSQRKNQARRAKNRRTQAEDIFNMDLSDDDRETTPVNVGDYISGLEPLSRTSSLPDVLDTFADDQNEDDRLDKSKSRRRKLSSRSVAFIPKQVHVSFAPTFSSRKMSVEKVQGTKSEGQLTPPPSLRIDDNANAGFLSDSEVDLKKNDLRLPAVDEGANVTWKWGQLPEKKVAETPEIMTPTSQGSLESIPEATQQSLNRNEQEKRSYLRGMFSFMRRPKPPVSDSVPKDIPKSSEGTDEAGKYLSDLVSEDLSQSQKEKYLALDQYGLSTFGSSDIHTNSPSAIQPANAENIASKGLAMPALLEIEGKSIELVPLAAQERGKGVDAIVNSLGQQDARSSSAYSSMASSPPFSDSDSDKNSEKSPLVHGPSYRKTLRLTSDQILTLPLQHGMNEAEFCIVTKYQGSARCKCNIFLWRYDDKIVISDIDGTITKSDVLGHILPIIGSTWAQAGVAGLYNRVASNGYNFMYLSSRAIGQASFTREHLKAIIQENVNLPEGPLLLSPKSLFLAFHQEVIVKRPEAFKIACLQDIRALFPKDRNPFFAAYGNKTTDLLSYRTVGVPMTRIFTINYHGQLKHEILRQAQSSYSQQTNLVDMLFPPLKTLPGHNILVSEHEHADEYSSFVFWKSPLPDIATIGMLPPKDDEVESSKAKKVKTKNDTGKTNSKSVSPTRTARNAPLSIL